MILVTEAHQKQDRKTLLRRKKVEQIKLVKNSLRYMKCMLIGQDAHHDRKQIIKHIEIDVSIQVYIC